MGIPTCGILRNLISTPPTHLYELAAPPGLAVEGHGSLPFASLTMRSPGCVWFWTKTNLNADGSNRSRPARSERGIPELVKTIRLE